MFIENEMKMNCPECKKDIMFKPLDKLGQFIGYTLKKMPQQEDIINIPIKDRTNEQHQFLIKTVYCGSVRDYLLSFTLIM